MQEATMVKPLARSVKLSNVDISTVTTSGSTQAGALAVTIINRGGAAGTVEGVALNAGEGWEFSGSGPYDAIAYDASGTSFDIVTVSE
jgi:hypothetical protein